MPRRARVALEYRMTVKNGRDTDVRLMVLDRIPVSRHEEIRVSQGASRSRARSETTV